MRSLNKILGFRNVLLGLRRRWLNATKGVKVHEGTSVSLSAEFIAGGKDAVTVADGTLIAFKTLLIARTPSGDIRPIHIGKDCFIGGGSTILPGVRIGDSCIVAAGAVVFDDVPANCIVGGNPARILRRDVQLSRFGRLPYADENVKRYWKPD